MTTSTKAFKIIICILLGLTILWTGFISYAFFYFTSADADRRAGERYGLYVGGVDVTAANAGDILGDGTASYDVKTNKLTLKNANIVYGYTVIYSEIDLLVELVGENKFVCKDNSAITAIYASNGILRKDLAFDGEGTLSISFENVTGSGTGIVADDLWIGCDITVTTPDCTDISNGIVCTSSLNLRNKANVTVNNGAARSSTAVNVRGNAILESGSALNVTVAPGATDACNGIGIDGSLTVARNASINVSVDDETAAVSECLSVSGFMSVGNNATVNASAKKVFAIEGNGAIYAGEGAVLTATTAGEGADIFCYGVFFNDGAILNAELEAIGGIAGKVNG